MTRIAAVIPVGPEKHHADYLGDALVSVAAQTREPDVVVVVDDMHGRGLDDYVLRWGVDARLLVLTVAPPWRLGVGHSFNVGCATAFNNREAEGVDLALMMGADDKLEPRVLEHLEATYEANKKAEGFYWLEVIYSDGEQQALPCNAAAVTAGFMRETGGLPIEASSGGMDAALVSAMLAHRPEYLIHVRGREGRYWVRRHPQQEGVRMGAYSGAMAPIRDAYTRLWEPTRWGRYE